MWGSPSMSCLHPIHVAAQTVVHSNYFYHIRKSTGKEFISYNTSPIVHSKCILTLTIVQSPPNKPRNVWCVRLG